MENGLILCAGCRCQQSVIAGTVFQDSHMPLPTWFRAMWHICANKNGMSAQNLQRLLGLRSYNTAWLCLHKLRRAMVRPGRERLSGTVEADETYVGGPKEGNSGRGAFGKQIVFIAAEVRSRKIGRIRLSHIPGVSGATLVSAVSEAVTAGSTVRTDGWQGYNGVTTSGYQHEVAVENVDELASALQRLADGDLAYTLHTPFLPTLEKLRRDYNAAADKLIANRDYQALDQMVIEHLLGK